MRKHKTAVIFAGGKSSRMGQDKALLPFGDHPTLSEFQYQRLNNLFEKVYLSAKEDKFNFDCPVITDTRKEDSPLVGILSLFETLEAEEVFILSVDAPFVNQMVIESIYDSENKEYDVVVAQSPSGIQPLCGIYKKSILGLAYQQLKENNHKLQDLLFLAKTLYVPFASDQPFSNLNHPQEYKKALMSYEDYP